jgi:hypothetical protein
MKAQELLEALRTWAPFIVFKIERARDDSFRWDGDGPDPCDEGFTCYDVDVSATAISKGREYTGHGSLGGHYDKHPFDDDLGGYLPQLLLEAAQELEDVLDEGECPAGFSDCRSAIRFLRIELKQRYDAQRATVS